MFCFGWAKRLRLPWTSTVVDLTTAIVRWDEVRTALRAMHRTCIVYRVYSVAATMGSD